MYWRYIRGVTYWQLLKPEQDTEKGGVKEYEL